MQDLQLFTRGELQNYDNDERYLFLFVTREQLDLIKEDKPVFCSQAVDSVDDYVRFYKTLLLEERRVFCLIEQKSHLLEQGYQEPLVVGIREEYAWNEVADNEFCMLVTNSPSLFRPVGYCALTMPVNNNADWMLFKW